MSKAGSPKALDVARARLTAGTDGTNRLDAHRAGQVDYLEPWVPSMFLSGARPRGSTPSLTASAAALSRDVLTRPGSGSAAARYRFENRQPGCKGHFDDVTEVLREHPGKSAWFVVMVERIAV